MNKNEKLKKKEIIRPITSIYPYLRFAADKGMDASVVLKNTTLTENDLFDPENDITLSQELTIVRNLVAQFPAPETIWELGRYFYSRAHGVVGKMMEAAPTLGDVFACWIEFAILLHVYFRINLETSGNKIRMYAENQFDLPADLDSMLLERDIIAGKSAVDFRLPGTFAKYASSISLAHDARTDLTKYRQHFLDDIRFNQKRNYVEIEKSSLNVVLPNADPHRYELYRQQCQAELSLRSDKRPRITDAVTLYFQIEKGMSDFTDIAMKMNMSERSLRLKLRNEGSSFRSIRNQYIFQQAVNYLSDPDVTIEEVSDLLGYSETCAFSRAFEKMAGIPPGQYRKKIILKDG